MESFIFRAGLCKMNLGNSIQKPYPRIRRKEAAMKAKVNPIPEGYHTVTPYLTISGASDAIEFYKKAFGAKELVRMPAPEGKIGHAELQIGDSRIMLADESAMTGSKSPKSLGGSATGIV